MTTEHTPTRLTTYALNDRLQRHSLLAEGPGTGKPVMATHIRRHEDARRLAACWNVCQGFNTDVLESITGLGETMLTRFQARDRVEQTLIADRLKAMQERDQLRALVLQLRSALRDHEQARVAMFDQCCSNPIFDSWGRKVDTTLLNDAHHATERALRASDHVEPPLVHQVLEDLQPHRPPAAPAPAPCPGGLPQCKWVDVPNGGSKCTTCGDTLPF